MGKIILIYAILSLISIAILYFLMTNSSEGYEDENGFHYNKPPDDMDKIPRCPMENSHTKKYELNEISPQVYECGCGTIFWFIVKDCAHWEILTHDDMQKIANIYADWQIKQRSQQA